jgi:hypothetical protein
MANPLEFACSTDLHTVRLAIFPLWADEDVSQSELAEIRAILTRHTFLIVLTCIILASVEFDKK